MYITYIIQYILILVCITEAKLCNNLTTSYCCDYYPSNDFYHGPYVLVSQKALQSPQCKACPDICSLFGLSLSLPLSNTHTHTHKKHTDMSYVYWAVQTLAVCEWFKIMTYHIISSVFSIHSHINSALQSTPELARMYLCSHSDL